MFPLAPDVFAKLLAMIQRSDDDEVERLARVAMTKLSVKLRARVEASLLLRQRPLSIVDGPERVAGAGSDGGPMLLVDAAAAPRWDASEADYERVCELAARSKAAFVQLGSTRALVLSEPGYELMWLDDGVLFICEGSDEEVWRFAIHAPRPGWKQATARFTSNGGCSSWTPPSPVARARTAGA